MIRMSLLCQKHTNCPTDERTKEEIRMRLAGINGEQIEAAKRAVLKAGNEMSEV